MATEELHPELIPHIDAWLEARANGESDWSTETFWREVLVPMGYSLRAATLASWCRTRRADVWQRAN